MRRPGDFWREPPPARRPPPRRPALREFEWELREMERRIIMSRRRELARLYRMLRRDMRRFIEEATGKKLPEPSKEEEEKEEKNFLENILGIDFDVDWGDVLKWGGAALAGALAVLLITHWDDIYSFFTRAKESGTPTEQLKEELKQYIESLIQK